MISFAFASAVVLIADFIFLEYQNSLTRLMEMSLLDMTLDFESGHMAVQLAEPGELNVWVTMKMILKSMLGPLTSHPMYCGRRVAKLYCAGRLFACRNRYRLGSAVQRDGTGRWTELIIACIASYAISRQRGQHLAAISGQHADHQNRPRGFPPTMAPHSPPSNSSQRATRRQSSSLT